MQVETPFANRSFGHRLVLIVRANVKTHTYHGVVQMTIDQPSGKYGRPNQMRAIQKYM